MQIKRCETKSTAVHDKMQQRHLGIIRDGTEFEKCLDEAILLKSTRCVRGECFLARFKVLPAFWNTSET